jgi:hypothetical protein
VKQAERKWYQYRQYQEEKCRKRAAGRELQDENCRTK